MIAKMNTAIEVRGLAKRFGDVIAVAGIDFDVQEGEVFGFLGPNGAGKSTTINMLIGLARPDAGTIRINAIGCSKNPKAAQHLMGVVPDESNLYPELSGFANLSFCGALYWMARTAREERACELLERFGLADAGGRKFGGYSKGMKRKLTIAAGIIHSPSILFMDEPTTGIEATAMNQENAPDLSGVAWELLIPAIVLIAVSSTFLGLFIAVSVNEVFEAQTFSNFFRFPMLFLCGLFFPVDQLPLWLQPLSYALPLTYGADILHAAIHRPPHLALTLDFSLSAAFCAILFALSLRNIRRKWIV